MVKNMSERKMGAIKGEKMRYVRSRMREEIERDIMHEEKSSQNFNSCKICCPKKQQAPSEAKKILQEKKVCTNLKWSCHFISFHVMARSKQDIFAVLTQ